MRTFFILILRVAKNFTNILINPIKLKVERINVETDFESVVIASLNDGNCDIVIDVGANTGQYAKKLITRGFKGKIISFEPLVDAYQKLLQNTKKHENWSAIGPVAIGEKNGTSQINISGNSVSSSLLEMEEAHRSAEKTSEYIGVQDVDVRSIMSYQDILAPFTKIYLKIDTQGFELHVLEGLGAVLEKIVFIQLEVSFIELYSQQCLNRDVETWMSKNNFEIWSIERGFSDPATGQILQADYIYRKLDD